MGSRGQQQEHIPIPIAGIKHVTAKAVLIDYFDADLGKSRAVWVPLSQIGDEKVEVDPNAKEINITPWFCDKEGLE